MYAIKFEHLEKARARDTQKLRAVIEASSLNHAAQSRLLSSEISELSSRLDAQSASLQSQIDALLAQEEQSQLQYSAVLGKLEQKLNETISQRAFTPEEYEMHEVRSQLAEKTVQAMGLAKEIAAIADAFEATRGGQGGRAGESEEGAAKLIQLQAMLMRGDVELIKRASKNAALQYEVHNLTNLLEAGKSS